MAKSILGTHILTKRDHLNNSSVTVTLKKRRSLSFKFWNAKEDVVLKAPSTTEVSTTKRNS